MRAALCGIYAMVQICHVLCIKNNRPYLHNIGKSLTKMLNQAFPFSSKPSVQKNVCMKPKTNQKSIGLNRLGQQFKINESVWGVLVGPTIYLLV